MRLVAIAAGCAAGVFLGIHLREVLRLGGVGFVAADAKDGRVGFLWYQFAGVVGVVGESAMAGFATDSGVLAGLLHFEFVLMTHGAGVAAGEGDRAGGDLAESLGTVVAVLTETGGYDEVTDDYEQDEAADK